MINGKCRTEKKLILTLVGVLMLISPLREGRSHDRREDDAIFQCLTQAENYAGRFLLTETGQFSLKASKGRDKFECSLRLKEYSYNSSAEAPNLTFRFTPINCRKSGGSAYLDRALVREMSIVVSQGATQSLSDKRMADVQWITYLQPSICKIEKYNRESLVRNWEKFRKDLF